jgi:hypothetical protein
MNGPTRLLLVPVLLACATAARAQGVSPQAPRDRPVDVASDSARARFYARMQPYLDSARATYPQARARFLAGLPAGQTFFVTTRLHDDAGHEEQVFVRVDSIANGTVAGRLASDIRVVRGYRNGQPLAFPEAEVFDWLITHPDGSEEGNVVGKWLDTQERVWP